MKRIIWHPRASWRWRRRRLCADTARHLVQLGHGTWPAVARPRDRGLTDQRRRSIMLKPSVTRDAIARVHRGGSNIEVSKRCVRALVEPGAWQRADRNDPVVGRIGHARALRCCPAHPRRDRSQPGGGALSHPTRQSRCPFAARWTHGCSAIGPTYIDISVTAGAFLHCWRISDGLKPSTSWTTPSAFETDIVAAPHPRGEMGVHPASALAARRQHRRRA